MSATPPLIVIGASAGGIEAMRRFIRLLSPDVPAAVAFVIHRQPVAEDERLPRVFAQVARIPVSHARDGEAIVAGRLVIAPAGLHLTVADGAFALSSGPRVNGARPAIDALFRSAARASGSATIGVLLSGLLDDGVAGLAEIKRHGGAALVQDPRDALFGDLPASAIANVDVDEVASVEELVARLPRYLEAASAHGARPGTPAPSGVPSRFTCPACGGLLTEERDAAVPQFRCRTGHRYSTGTLVEQQEAALENALYVALRTLDERADKSRRIARRMHERGLDRAAQRLEREACDADDRARIVRDALRSASDAAAESEVQATVDAAGER